MTAKPRLSTERVVTLNHDASAAFVNDLALLEGVGGGGFAAVEAIGGVCAVTEWFIRRPAAATQRHDGAIARLYVLVGLPGHWFTMFRADLFFVDDGGSAVDKIGAVGGNNDFWGIGLFTHSLLLLSTMV
jgi:hypothetical protein